MRLKQESLQRGGDTKSVELVMENGQAYPLKGSLQFSDVTVDESTGSITLRAIFPNPQHVLLPGCSSAPASMKAPIRRPSWCRSRGDPHAAGRCLRDAGE
jgi:multidrug efflux pump subunit AcrA (membrane-fusion protein)